MKTAHLVVGIILIIFGVILGVGATFVGGGTCIDDPNIARILGVQSCAQAASQVTAVGGAGLLFLIIGIVVLATGGEKRASGVAQVDGPQLGFVLCPHCAGQNYPTAVYCQWCSKPMKVET